MLNKNWLERFLEVEDILFVGLSWLKALKGVCSARQKYVFLLVPTVKCLSCCEE